jgi:hypothetical protein
VPPALELLTVENVLALPNPKWLLKPLFAQGALVVAYGPPGSGKSFLMLDWSMSIASSTAWLDYPIVSRGRVVYVVGEGTGGLRKGVRAWMGAHAPTVAPEALFFPVAVQLLQDDDIKRLLALVRPHRPVLVVIDTFAMCFAGDENNSKDVSRAIAAAKKIIRETGATVILVHHTGKKGLAERGHSALRAAADTMMLVEAKRDARGGTLIVVTNDKQKDQELFLPITVRLTRVSVEKSDEGEAITTCVLEPTDTTASDARQPSSAETLALTILAEKFPDGAHTTRWRKAIERHTSTKLKPRTYQNHRIALMTLGLVESVPGQQQHYRATDCGRSIVRRPKAANFPSRTSSRRRSWRN